MPEEELNNLARIGLLDKVPFSAALLQKMLATARTRLQQAQALSQLAEQKLVDPHPEGGFVVGEGALSAKPDAAQTAKLAALLRLLDDASPVVRGAVKGEPESCSA